MVEFKVGDKIESVSDEDLDIHIGRVYEATKVMGNAVYFDDSAGFTRHRLANRYKLYTPTTPPTTITHEGYAYTRGERVLPDWVKDGAWVVNTGDGLIEEIVSCGSKEIKVRSQKYGNTYRYNPSDFSVLFRPFTATDWKWGMWAMYEGKKVIVMDAMALDGAQISHPSFENSEKWVDADLLTPTK